MKNHLLSICLAALLAPWAVRAGVPEPDNVIYGSIVLDGAAITSTNTQVFVEARRTINGPVITSYRMGSSANAQSFFILRLPVESGTPLSGPEVSVSGDTVHFLVYDESGLRDQKSFIIGSRGKITRLDFGSLDSDSDGLRDDWENTHFGGLSHADGGPNADPDGDGLSNLGELTAGLNPLVKDSRHPADRSIADNQISILEVTAYGAAWKREDPWPTGPQPSDTALLDFVSRAGTLWLGGEYYALDTNQTVAPTWWINVAPPERQSVKVGAALEESTVKTNALIAGLPWQFSLGQPFHITNQVILADGARSFAVELKLPEGWSADQFNEGGSFQKLSRTVRFGPFFDGAERALIFRAVPASNTVAECKIAGNLSVDGASVSLTGNTSAGSGAPALKMTITGGEATLSLQAVPGIPQRIEFSSDLVQWLPLQTVIPSWPGLVEVKINSGSSPQQFFRVVQE